MKRAHAAQHTPPVGHPPSPKGYGGQAPSREGTLKCAYWDPLSRTLNVWRAELREAARNTSRIGLGGPRPSTISFLTSGNCMTRPSPGPFERLAAAPLREGNFYPSLRPSASDGPNDFEVSVAFNAAALPNRDASRFPTPP